MKVLYVFCHPEEKSFGASLAENGVNALRAAGHEVMVSDLYRMGFNPIATEADFLERRFPDQLYYDREQKFSCQNGSFASDIQTEIDKLNWCDTLVLQFPLWWFSVPALMKGWIDRVFANGIAYGGGLRFDKGPLTGRRAMLALTTACYENMAATDGLVGDLNVVLWHLHSGTLAYTGMQVLPPFVGYSVQYTDAAQRDRYVKQYVEQLLAMDRTEPMFFHRLEDFSDWRLKPELPQRTVGQHRNLFN